VAEITWVKIPKISLASAARNAGFDISIFYEYAPSVQNVVRYVTIKDARAKLHEMYLNYTGEDLNMITRAVYVICVGWPFAVEYGSGHSEIIYIGIGNVMSRLKSHLENSLFDLMLSLQGIDFTFLISAPHVKNAVNAYKHIEYLMLEEFRNKCGGGKSLPLLNSNAGAFQSNIKTEIKGWTTPLKQAGKTPRWLIKPTKHNEFAALD
jgi:hypothetical protein